MLLDGGYGNQGEPNSRSQQGRKGCRNAIRGAKLLPEAEVAAEMRGRYQSTGPERKSGSSVGKNDPRAPHDPQRPPDVDSGCPSMNWAGAKSGMMVRLLFYV
jgi:hypothetical protein